MSDDVQVREMEPCDCSRCRKLEVDLVEERRLLRREYDVVAGLAARLQLATRALECYDTGDDTVAHKALVGVSFDRATDVQRDDDMLSLAFKAIAGRGRQ